MDKILGHLWNLSKTNKIVRNFLSALYYLLNGNKKQVKGKGNIIEVSGTFLRKVKFDIVGENNTVIVKPYSRVSNLRFHIRGSGHQIEIGENCNIEGGSFWFEDCNCKVIIGAKTFIGNVHFAVTEPGSTINIGENCLFSSDIDIRTGDSHSIIDLKTGNRVNNAENINICDHVWVASHVRILKGVTIGKNAIIGTGTVVTKSIPNNSLAAGSPAKVLKENVTWTHERIVS